MPNPSNQEKVQFRVLYREFLLRIVDLELLSAHGDVVKLLGQFASVPITFSLLCGLYAFVFGAPPPIFLIARWSMEHFLIATTMVLVGMVAVLSWDSIFLNRTDVLVLAPLPIRTRTLFLAKVAALATTLGLSILALNFFTGFTWPLIVFSAGAGLLSGIRAVAAYWITMVAAGAFIFSSVLTVQGLASQILPRQQFLRLSALLQLAAFFIFLTVYFLEPSLATPHALIAPENQVALAWLPSYWFLGLFQQLNGSMHPAFISLAQRAWIGLAVSCLGAGASLLLSYFRTLKRIVEQPDIVRSSRHATHWSPRFGNTLQTAVVLFSTRTLLRSRQHRVLLSFYLGIGFAIVLFYIKTPLAQQQLLAGSTGPPWHRLSAPLLAACALIMCFAIAGIRIVFSLPFELRANWTFRIAEAGQASEYLPPTRRSLLVLAVVPVCVVSAALCFWLWPPLAAAAHLVLLGLIGTIIAEVGLIGFHKIPFTCSYLPGKSNIHFAFWASFVLLIQIFNQVGKLERRALENVTNYACALLILVATLALARWRNVAASESAGRNLEFEEVPPEVIVGLGLNRD